MPLAYSHSGDAPDRRRFFTDHFLGFEWLHDRIVRCVLCRFGLQRENQGHDARTRVCHVCYAVLVNGRGYRDLNLNLCTWWVTAVPEPIRAARKRGTRPMLMAPWFVESRVAAMVVARNTKFLRVALSFQAQRYERI